MRRRRKKVWSKAHVDGPYLRWLQMVEDLLGPETFERFCDMPAPDADRLLTLLKIPAYVDDGGPVVMKIRTDEYRTQQAQHQRKRGVA